MPKIPKAEQSAITLPSTCTRSQFGALVGLSERSISELVGKSIVVLGSDKRVKTKESLLSYIKHLREQAAGRDAEGLNLATERALLARTQREEQEMKNAKLRGETMTLQEVKEGWSRFATIVRTSILSLPSRIRARVPHLTPHDGVEIESEIRLVLEEAAEELEGGAVPGARGPEALGLQ